MIKYSKILFIYSIIVSVLFAQENNLKSKGNSKSNKFSKSLIIQRDSIAVNEIKMLFRNNGIGSHDPHKNAGLFWPGGKYAVNQASYVDGLIWGGIINGDTLVGGSHFESSLQPGIINKNCQPEDPENPIFKIWKFRNGWEELFNGPEKERLEYDYHNWPIELGAPWEDNNNDGIYTAGIDNPKLYGDESNWMIMNDFGTSSSSENAFTSDPLQLEVELLIYAFNTDDYLKDVIFKQYNVTNKGSETIKNFVLGYWADPDVGSSSNDYIGCDKQLDLGFGYNGYEDDPVYNIPPAIGYMLLQGPILEGSENDSAYINQNWIKGYKNSHMESFAPIVKNWYMGIQGAHNSKMWYNNLHGLRTFYSDPLINPTTDRATLFGFDGDPVTKTGWYEGGGDTLPYHPPYDRKLMINTHEFNLLPGESKQVVYTIIMAQGSDRLNSVKILKEKANLVRDFYYSKSVIKKPKTLPKNFFLSQNYPNPFNPVTTIDYSLPEEGNVSIKVYDILGRVVSTLIDNYINAGNHSLHFDGSKYSSGIYIYRMLADEYSETKKMILLK